MAFEELEGGNCLIEAIFALDLRLSVRDIRPPFFALLANSLSKFDFYFSTANSAGDIYYACPLQPSHLTDSFSGFTSIRIVRTQFLH